MDLDLIIKDIEADPMRRVEVVLLGPVALDMFGEPVLDGDIRPIPYGGPIAELFRIVLVILGVEDDDTDLEWAPLGSGQALCLRSQRAGLSLSIVGLGGLGRN